MSKFKKRSKEMPAISTSSLPDIVFMLLFFFMTVTVMKSEDLMIDNELPMATEIKRLEKKDRVIVIHIGKPVDKLSAKFGSESKIQLNDKFASVEDIGPYILEQRALKPEDLRAFITVSLKVDRKANMGLVSDVKQELRKVHAYKINYTTYDGDVMNN